MYSAYGINPYMVLLQAVTWVDEGLVKSIRGVTFSTRVSPQFENRMIHSARGIFNRLLPDVHIFTDHKSGPQAGRYICSNCKQFILFICI